MQTKAETGPRHAMNLPPMLLVPRACHTARHTNQLAQIAFRKVCREGVRMVLLLLSAADQQASGQQRLQLCNQQREHTPECVPITHCRMHSAQIMHSAHSAHIMPSTPQHPPP